MPDNKIKFEFFYIIHLLYIEKHCKSFLLLELFSLPAIGLFEILKCYQFA